MLSKLLAVLGVGLLVSGTALASLRGATTVAITGTPVVKLKWRESYVVKGSGTLTFSATETVAGEVEASLRNLATNKVLINKRFSVAAGPFTKSLPLSARPDPGAYRLRVKEFPTGNASDKTVEIPAPPEGVIDKAYTSRTQNGPPAKVIKNAKTIYAHFHFLAAPQAKTLTFNWRKPGNPQVRFTGYAKKPYKTSVSTFVCVKAKTGGSCLNLPLRKGKWYCLVYANGRVVKRQLVTVT
jgi:hypothetical protein